jgi:hypothetical protein
MSSPEVFRKQGDNWPPMYEVLQDDQRAPIDLSDATITWEQRPVTGGSWVSGGAVTVTTPEDGAVSYMPDTTTVGDFIGHFLVSQLGKLYTVPDDGYILVHVLE